MITDKGDVNLVSAAVMQRTGLFAFAGHICKACRVCCTAGLGMYLASLLAHTNLSHLTMQVYRKIFPWTPKVRLVFQELGLH